MARRTGGQLVVEALRREGVSRVFSLSGGVINPIYEACREAGLPVVHTRHEGGAGFMADGWARATGQPGVCIVTLGPGVTNVLTPLLTALEAGSPLVVLAGQAPLARWDRGAPQAVHHLPLVSAACKWARTVYETARIPEYVGAAFREALTGQPGPVFLDLPANVLYGEAEPPAPLGTHRTRARPWPEPALVEQAAELVATAERPLLVAGSGVWWSGAAREVRQLAEEARLPVLTARMGRGTLPRGHELHFGLASIPDNRVAERALRETDLLLMLGERFDYYFEYGEPPHVSASARVVQVHADARQIGWNRGVDVGILGDVGATAQALRVALRARGMPRTESWLTHLAAERRAYHQELARYWESDAAPMHPLRVAHELLEVLADDAILVTGHGDVDFWADILFEPTQPGGYLRAGQTGALGAEIPMAIAAKLAHPQRQVAVLLGDGAFGYHGMELEVAATHGANVLCVIANDAAWGATKHQQELYYGKDRAYATSTEFRHYERVVEALGGYGELVRAPSELRPALERALASGKPSCVNVVTASEPSPFISRHAARR